jgi:hypothetical protein
VIAAVSIRDAATAERAALEALQRRSSEVWEAYRPQLRAHPDAITLPQGFIDNGWVRVATGGDDTPIGFSGVMPTHASVITALIGAALGLPLGIFLSMLVTQALSHYDIAVSIPLPQLVAFTVVAILAGVGAAIVPACLKAERIRREALRMTVFGEPGATTPADTCQPSSRGRSAVRESAQH